MTAEKGEHERAPNVSDSYPTPLRATLRAPPSKWAIEAFFPAGERSEPRSRTARRAPADRSPRRAAGRAASGVAVPRAFFGTFFRFERKYCPLRGGSPTTRAVVGASGFVAGGFTQQSSLPFAADRGLRANDRRCQNKTSSHRTAYTLSCQSRRTMPHGQKNPAAEPLYSNAATPPCTPSSQSHTVKRGRNLPPFKTPGRNEHGNLYQSGDPFL